MCTRHFGSVAANTVRNFRPDELPLLLIISRNRGSNEVMQVIHGTGLVSTLILIPQKQNGNLVTKFYFGAAILFMPQSL